MRAPAEHLVDAGARQHPAREAPDPLAFGFVIGIEQERPAFVVKTVAGHMIAQQEGLPEPRRVRQMPFGGRGVFHRLDGGVALAQRRGERLGQRARGIEALFERALLRLCPEFCRSHGFSPTWRAILSHPRDRNAAEGTPFPELSFVWSKGGGGGRLWTQDYITAKIAEKTPTSAMDAVLQEEGSGGLPGLRFAERFS